MESLPETTQHLGTSLGVGRISRMILLDIAQFLLVSLWLDFFVRSERPAMPTGDTTVCAARFG